MFEKIEKTGLFDAVTRCILQYAEAISSAADSQPNPEEDDHPMNDGNMISTGGPRRENTYTEQTIAILLSLLTHACKYSLFIISKILSESIINVLASLLPDESQD